MNDTQPRPGLARLVWQDFRHSWGVLVLFDAAFKLMEAWLLVPAIALVLSLILSKAGQVAITNRAIVDFLLSPLGLLYAVVFGTVAVALLLLEQAGLMVLARGSDAPRPSWRTIVLKTLRIAELGAVKLILLTLTLAPFAVLAGLVYFLLLSGHDVNYYLANRPPTFWIALGIGGVTFLVALFAGLSLYVRWVFALPILLFERMPARAALRASWERVRGNVWRIGFILVGWQLTAVFIGAFTEAGFRLLAEYVLAGADERPSTLIALLLIVRGGLHAALSFVTVVGQALLTRRLYLQRNEQLDLVGSAEPSAPPETVSRRRGYLFPALVGLSLVVVLLSPLAVWIALPQQLASLPVVKVTAHRGYSRLAPENTLSAVRKAIDHGADYAEIDVQLSADGVIVLAHDRDFKRVAGVGRRVDEMTYPEIRELDVGGWFSSSFAGERVPTLEEVILLAKGKIKLNVELKHYGSGIRLAEQTAELLRKHDFESDCIVTSFDADSLHRMREVNPKVRTGLIVAQALGNVSKLEGDALSVRADWLTDEVLHAAHRAEKEVHVWTVNDRRRMARFIKRGVDNVITDEPGTFLEVRDEWTSLTAAEQLLLASRLLLGLDR